MTLYFKIENGTTDIIDTFEGALVDFNTKAISQINGKPFFVIATITDPAFTPITQVRTGPIDTYDGTAADRVFTVRAKTQAEIDAERDAASEDDLRRIKTAVLYAAEKAGDDITILAVRLAAFDRAKEIYQLLN